MFPRNISVAIGTLLALLFCAHPAGGQTVYDFSTNAGVDRFAFKESVPATPIPPDVNNIPSVAFIASAYATIAASDSASIVTLDFGGGLRAAWRFEFTLAEPGSSLTQLDVLWEGGAKSDAFGFGQVDVWVWNAATGAYVLVDSTVESPPPDEILTRSFTTDAPDYVDAGNRVTVLVTNSKSNNGLMMDYVKITITADVCTSDAECDDGNACTDDACVSFICQNTNNTTPCSDGNVCTVGDACSGGSCLSGTPPDCSGLGDQCNTATCDLGGAEGNCDTFTPAVDGTVCDDGDACNAGETCLGGFCTGGLPTDCSGAGDQCNAASCDLGGAEGNCDVVTPFVDGTACDDADPCTTTSCQSGSCVIEGSSAEITINLEVEAIDNTVVRDVTFTMTTCGGGVDTRLVPVLFDDFGLASVLLVDVDPGAEWLAVSEGHTLRRLAGLSISACVDKADLTGPSRLLSGDLHTIATPQDGVVDITDFSIVAANWNQTIDSSESTGADVTADGLQSTADFTAIQVNFFTAGDGMDACPNLFVNSADLIEGGFLHDGNAFLRSDSAVPAVTSLQSLRRVPQSEIAVDQLDLVAAQRADLNADGIVDASDIRAFARRHRLVLIPSFEQVLRTLESRCAGRPMREE